MYIFDSKVVLSLERYLRKVAGTEVGWVAAIIHMKRSFIWRKMLISGGYVWWFGGSDGARDGHRWLK